MDRREMLKTSAGIGAGLLLGEGVSAQSEKIEQEVVEIGLKDKCCWTYGLQEANKASREKELVKKWNHKLHDCGGWRKEDLAVVLENSDNANNVYNEGKDSVKNQDITCRVMSGLSSPYLVGGRAMSSMSELVPYQRERFQDNKIYKVVECESLVCSVNNIDRIEEYNEYYEEFSMPKIDFIDSIDKMIGLVDFEIFKTLYCNARSSKCKLSELSSNAKEMQELMIKNIGISKTNIQYAHQKQAEFQYPYQFWMLMSPENAIKFNLHDVNPSHLNKHLERSYSVKKPMAHFSSDLMPNNIVLMGIKSSNYLCNGYVFCPYVVPAPDVENRLTFAYGRKLLREGSNYFGAIEIV